MTTPTPNRSRLARFAWAVLGYNLAVVAWGAYVRATRSGAGCGAHWPLCNGQVLPLAPSSETLVEFTHRATSGLALLFVVALLAWVWRACPRGHAARPAAALSMAFMLAEAGVGAALVLFRLVADNATMARAAFMAVHLANTFLLLACLALTAYWLSGGRPVEWRGRGREWARFGVGAAAILLAGVSGAVAALGDTLYPSGSLAEALAADMSAASHVFVRLRLFHPGIALGAAVLLILTGLKSAYEGRGLVRRLGAWVAVLACVQVLAGFVNVLLLAPVWMQIVHLLIADALWLAYILLGAGWLQARPAVGRAPNKSPAVSV